jgi:hypothetical protein
MLVRSPPSDNATNDKAATKKRMIHSPLARTRRHFAEVPKSDGTSVIHSKFCNCDLDHTARWPDDAGRTPIWRCEAAVFNVIHITFGNSNLTYRRSINASVGQSSLAHSLEDFKR